MENLIQTSGDILNLVIAAAVALFVIFVCWGLFYTVMAVRNIFKITKDARKNFQRVEEILAQIKEQLQAGTFYVSLLKEGISKGVEFLRKKTGAEKNKKSNNKKKTNRTKTATQKKTAKTSSANKTTSKNKS